MNNLCLLVVSWLLVAVWATAGHAAEVTVGLDRSQIALDETVTLSIAREGGNAFPSVDLRPLEKDFWIRSRNKSSSSFIVNGSLSSTFNLDVILAPKRAGSLSIPPLLVGTDKTRPLKVKVVTHAQPKTNAVGAPIFIETEVDSNSVFVQAQVLFTLRIFWAVDANITEPADPVLVNAPLERAGDATYTKDIDGRTHRVFERKYAIFPQQSGILEIPQIIIQVTIPTRPRQRSIYDMFGNRGKQIKLRSEATRVTVREIPAAYPAGATWLPTAALELNEEWSVSPEELQVGESVTINIGLKGGGLLGTQLPPVELPDAAGVKLYQGKAEVENVTSDAGITGIRQESIALIPTRAGTVELPAVRIPWWNKGRNRIEYAEIPARSLKIKAAESAETAGSEIPPGAGQLLHTESEVVESVSNISSRQVNLLIGLCFILSLIWLATLFMLVRTRRQLSALKVGEEQEEAARKTTERAAFKKLGRACRANDPGRARAALLAWGQAFRPETGIMTGVELINLYPDSGLAALVGEIDNILYNQGGTDGEWQGRRLLEKVAGIRKNESGSNRKEPALNPLYK
ncbi:MAG: BatD family protein [Thermodesulfobacteriota bacterium]